MTLLTVLLARCSDEPDLGPLTNELRRDGNSVLEKAQSLAPAHHEGDVTVRDQNAERDVACPEAGSIKRVFAGQGVGEYGAPAPARVANSAQALVGFLRGWGYEVDRQRDSPRRSQLWLSKSDGDLTFRIVVDDGEPVRWRVVGETRCVPAD